VYGCICVCVSSQRMKQWTDFHKTRYEYRAIGTLPTVLHFGWIEIATLTRDSGVVIWVEWKTQANYSVCFFDVLLTVHLSINSVMYKFLFDSKFIIFLYMFRALLCSSSGGQNCIIQHLVSSHSVGGRLVRRLREDSNKFLTAQFSGFCYGIVLSYKFLL
jgi:hypothetical protein